MAELVGAVASPLVEGAKLVFGPIYRHTKSFFKLQSNLSSLQQKTRVLRETEAGVKQELEAADRDGKSATPRVKEWLRQVGEILVVADQMQPGMIAGNRGLVSGCFLSCGVCRKVRKTLEKVERLAADACPADTIVANNRPLPTVEHIPGPSIGDHTTASRNLNRVMDLLIGDKVGSVGIWGMGGVGKTTLVKNLNNKLKGDGQRFGLVIWATVSKDFNRRAVQTQIANRLEIQVGESDADRMMVRLHERLMKEKKFILILDDIWEAIDLDRLGIPDPRKHKGVKILLTSRSSRVCHEMKMDRQVQVQVMDDKESWELFSETVGRKVTLKEIKPIAVQVCQQCCGLPLAIVIVGAAMRGKDTAPLWNNALTELQRSVPFSGNIEDKVFKPLKWSYDKLQGNDVKSCFLYCCLYPEDFSIQVSELFKCWVGEGLIDEELNYEQSRNHGLALIQNLREACLLETGEHADTVKMHDVVRDVAIWIASNYSEDGSKFLVKAGIGLARLSEVKLTKDLKRISFMNNRIMKLPCDDTCSIECSNASTLFLQRNDSIVEIPDRFMRRFQAIKVLNLSRTSILSLPSSVMQLTEISTLLLDHCLRLTELPTSGWEGLKKLQVFDLSNTPITALPKGMEMMIKLRELNLSYTFSLRSIPAEVFSMLSSLEMLNMEQSSYIWGSKGGVQDGGAYLEELESLNKLSELFIEVKPKSSLIWVINPTWVATLTNFKFCIGCTAKTANTLFERIHSLSWKEIIMKGINPAEEELTEYLVSTTNATSLSFQACRGLDKFVQKMGLSTATCFSALESLTIEYASMNLKDTLGGVHGAKYDLLPNLEYLYLNNVSGMRSISDLAGHLGLTFSKLQKLHVMHCKEMEHLLTVGPHMILENLQCIDVSNCRGLEGVLQYAHNYHPVEVVPKLDSIYLSNLPELRTLCKSNKAETWPRLEKISVRRCDELRSLPVSDQSNMIKEIQGEESWWNNLEWDDPSTKNSLQHLFERMQ